MTRLSNPDHRRRGFTLVELSIVLVILALVIDDGVASTGKTVGFNGRHGTFGSPSNCVTPNTWPTLTASADYVPTTADTVCSMAFTID